jgi:alcohol dehydrogenase class IV
MTPGKPPGGVPAFEFATAQRIVFGAGKAALLPALATDFGRRVLVVTGATIERHRGLLDALAEAAETVEVFAVGGEPAVATVMEGVERAQAANAEVVVALGGGSVIDTGKAIAALSANPGDPLDYLEVVGRGHALSEAPLPCVAVPTTAGTGAEVTRNAVLAVPEERVKVSLRSPRMLPEVALVDPALTLGLPPALTASTGMDALTQLIEPFLCARPNPLTDALCREAIPRAARALRRAVRTPDDLEARAEMALASLFGGLALANAGLGAAHGFAGPMGGMFPAPHGALCARLLPGVLRANLDALRSRAPANPVLARFEALGPLLTGEDGAGAEEAVTWCVGLVEELGIPRLRHWGVAEDDLPAIVEKAGRASSMKANPIVLTEAELRSILEAAF